MITAANDSQKVSFMARERETNNERTHERPLLARYTTTAITFKWGSSHLSNEEWPVEAVNETT